MNPVSASAAPTGYARFVGRVGALAVALGVGVAVASSYGVPLAHAEDTEQAPTDQQGDSAPGAPGDPVSPDDGGPKGAPSEERPATPTVTVNGEVVDGGGRGGTNTSDPGGATSAVPKMNFDAQGADDAKKEGAKGKDADDIGVADPPLANVPPAVDSAVDSTPADPPTAPEPPDAPEPPVDETAPVGVVEPDPPVTPAAPEGQDSKSPGGNDVKLSSGQPNPSPDITTGKILNADSGDVDPVDNSDIDVDTGNRIALFSAVDSSASQGVSTLIAPSPNIIEPEQPDLLAGLAALPGVVVRLVATIFAAALAPFVQITGPIAPPQPPTLWALLAWVRREFERTLHNQTPHAVDDTSATTDEGEAVDIAAVVNDTDSDEDPLAVTDFTQPLNGHVDYNQGTQTFTYTPNAGFIGEDTFEYAVSDEGGLPHWHGVVGGLFNLGHQDVATVTVKVTAVDDPLEAADDAASTDEDNPAVGNVLDNDLDDDPISVSTPGLVIGTHGVLSLDANGEYTYTPGGVITLDPDQATQGTVDYDWVGDNPGTRNYIATTFTAGATGRYDFGQPGGDTDTIIAVYNGDFDPDDPSANLIGYNDDTVEFENLKPTFTADLVEDRQYTVVISTWDTDVPLDLTLTVAATATADPANALQVGEHAEDTFDYTVTNGYENGTATITVTVYGVNDAPVIVDVDTEPGTAPGIIEGTVIATDVDGDPLTYAASNGAHGTVSIDPTTGAFVYTPTKILTVIPGSDFESGDLSGWSTGGQPGTPGPVINREGTGSTVSTGSLTFDPTEVTDPDAPPDLVLSDWLFTPAGDHAAALSPNGSQTFADAGQGLGLTAAQQQQQQLITTSSDPLHPGGPQDAAWITRVVHLEAGTTYTMSWNYISTDYEPYNDGSITTLVSVDDPTATVYVNGYESNYAILGFTNAGTGDYSTKSFSSTGWQTSTYEVSQTGEYKVGFAVFNLRDEAFDPVLLVDSEAGTTTRDGQVYNPVPPNSPTAPRTVDDTFTVTVDDGVENDEAVVTVPVTIVGALQI